jgi:predicted signal transduction protein with EAL and GGDEF domain
MGIWDQIVGWIKSAEGAVVVIATVVDFALRLIPSQKPLSVLYFIVDVIKGVEKVLEAVARFLDKVLPQRVKPAAELPKAE